MKSSIEEAHTPRSNLSESMHGSWLAGEGYKDKITLYDACVSDMANALLQSAKQYGYLNGKHLGEGPSLEKLIDRATTRNTPTPTQAARVMQEAVAGTPMYEESTSLHGDKETVQRKRGRAPGIDDSSHRPGYVMSARDRPMQGATRRVSFGTTPQPSMVQVIEEPVARAMWAIRRTPVNSRLKCFGLIDGKKKCNSYIQSSSIGVVAPSFYSERRHPGPGGPKPQMMWFCPTDVSHTWHVDHNIIYKPNLIGNWTVDVGTNITNVEVQGLLKAGFNLQVVQNPISSTSNRGDTTTPLSSKDPSAEGGSTKKKRSTKWRHGISQEAEKRIRSAGALTVSVIDESIMEPLKHSIFRLVVDNGNEYFVHVKVEPLCTCPDFMQREAGEKPYLACKHLYFVFIRVLGLQKNEDMIIHQPTLSSLDVSKILSRPRRSSL